MGIREYRKSILRSFLHLVLWIVALLCHTRAEETDERVENHFTPVPLLDINKDLRLLFFGSKSDYFISTYQADALTARKVCQNLTDLTGKHFHVLVLENADEVKEVTEHLDGLEISGGIWTAGEKNFNSQGAISVFWSTGEGTQAMTYKNFRQGIYARSRESKAVDMQRNFNSSSSLMYPWLGVKTLSSGGKCRIGKYTPPECEPVQCNVTMPECQTITPPCTVKNQSECSVTRPPCSAKCENCTVIPGDCVATPKPCTVKTEPCQTVRAPCNITTPPCTTTRPPCKTIQPPCDVTTPAPCTTARPKCTPSFRNDNCTTVTFPCKTNKKNETICPAPKTVCAPSFKCPPPEICQSPAIICPPPLIYCEPETTICPDPIVECPKPVIYCPQPQVDCPEPDVVCSPPKVLCSPPVVSCPGIVTSCPSPQLDCPAPQVTCPEPQVTCSKPEPCEPPEVTLPPCLTEPTTTTTRKPCTGCGCVVLSKKHDFKWDIEACRKEYHFICEG